MIFCEFGIFLFSHLGLVSDATIIQTTVKASCWPDFNWTSCYTHKYWLKKVYDSYLAGTKLPWVRILLFFAIQNSSFKVVLPSSRYLSLFVKIDPQTHSKTSQIYFGPTKTLTPLTKTFLGSKTPWNPPVIPFLTASDPPRFLTKPKTNQQSSIFPLTPTKTPIPPYPLKNYSPGLLSTLQDPCDPFLIAWDPHWTSKTPQSPS